MTPQHYPIEAGKLYGGGYPGDRNLIVPAPYNHWQASRVLDLRRSTGDKELANLFGQILLLPQDQAFRPDADGPRW